VQALHYQQQQLGLDSQTVVQVQAYQIYLTYQQQWFQLSQQRQ
jgi:hypothetical protein